MTTETQRDAQRQMWTVGNYSAVAEKLAPISAELVRSIPITAGTSVLDVAVGDGNTAIEAAKRGALVTGIDLTPSQIDKASARTSALGLDIALQVGDAEAIPFPDASFDVVVSVMGMIFAPDHEQAAAELHRVCRPGGTVAITAWAVEGWAVAWRRRASEVVPSPAGAPPGPDAWGDPIVAADRLRAAGLDADATVQPFSWEFASVDAALEFYTTHAAPFLAFLAAADSIGRRADALGALRETMEATNQATDGTCRLSSPYVRCLATRGD